MKQHRSDILSRDNLCSSLCWLTQRTITALSDESLLIPCPGSGRKRSNSALLYYIKDRLSRFVEGLYKVSLIAMLGLFKRFFLRSLSCSPFCLK